MRTIHVALIAAAVAAVFWPGAGMAYFGPGAGVTMLSAISGVLLAIGFAVFALLAWPVRALLRRRRTPAPPVTTGTPKPDARA